MPQIQITDRAGGAVFLAPTNGDSSEACNYYRAALPARMVGGVVRHSIDVAVDGGQFTPFYPYSERDIGRVLDSGTVTFRGMGRPTILASRELGRVPRAFDFVRAVTAAHPGSIWLETDDYMGVPFLAGLIGHFLGVGPAVALQMAHDYHQVAFTSTQHHVVATEPIRTAVLRHNPKALVLVGPNAVDPGEIPVGQRASDRIRVGYGAATLHALDAPLVLDGLAAVSRAGAEVWFCGWHPAIEKCGTQPGRYHFRDMEYRYAGPIADFRAFHARIAEWDVAVAPLVDCEFNRCKSPQKWFEHSLHETPMVVSDLVPYACVEHGVTGFKARNGREFAEHLVRLCSDVELRERMGRAARAAVIKRHTTANYREQWGQMRA
jgi:hypothetical protein